MLANVAIQDANNMQEKKDESVKRACSRAVQSSFVVPDIRMTATSQNRFLSWCRGLTDMYGICGADMLVRDFGLSRGPKDAIYELEQHDFSCDIAESLEEALDELTRQAF